jgi:phosphoglycolate phosphatase-like HAD superfamily hydrolase
MAAINEIKVLIFDFDGVIVESNGIKDKVFQQLFNAFPDHSEELMKYHVNHVSESRTKKFDFLLKITGREHDTTLKEKLMDDFSLLSIEQMRSVKFVSGARELLNKMSHFPLYLASVTPISDLQIIIQSLDLGQFFKDIYGCPPWTKSNAIQEILNIEKVRPDQALLIGDSNGDQRSAKETGIHFIARDSGLPFDEPSPIKFNDLNQIAEYFKTLNI